MEENYIWPEITKETTLEEVREIHKRIWEHVVKNGVKPKTPYMFNCVLCEYKGLFSTCSACPAIWGGSGYCSLGDGEYAKWMAATYSAEFEKATEIAKQIRDIPFKQT